MRLGHSGSCARIVKLLLSVPPRDAMIFDPGKFSNRRGQSRPEMFERKFETDVAIKFAISRIARITLGRAPDLPARIAIARENRGPGWREAGRVNRTARSRLAKHQPVGVDDEPAHARFPQH